MVDDQRFRRFVHLASCFVWLALLRPAAWGQSPPVQANLPRASTKFSTPRETLKTLYFSIIAYDFHPALIDDAVACLEQCPGQPRDVGEMARLAIELDAILQELCLPVHGVPENPSEDQVVLHDGDGFKIALGRQADGQWRFDRE